MADPLLVAGRLVDAGVPFALAGPWAVDASVGRPLRAAGAEVVVPPGREAEAGSLAGAGVAVRPRSLEDGDVVDVAVAGRSLPCLRADLLLLALVDPSPSPSPSPGDVADAQALAAATGLSLPPLPGGGAGVPAAAERGEAVGGLSPAPPALVPPGAVAAESAAAAASGPPPAVRDATAADLAAVAAVHVATWRAAYAGHMPARFLARLDAVRRWRQWSAYLANPDRRGHLLVTGGPAVVDAFCMCGPAVGGPGGEVHAVYCHPSAWGTGRGRALLAAAEDLMRRDGVAEAVLWVLGGNERARRFYEAAGWAPDGAIRSEEVGPPGDRLVVEEVRYRVALR